MKGWGNEQNSTKLYKILWTLLKMFRKDRTMWNLLPSSSTMRQQLYFLMINNWYRKVRQLRLGKRESLVVQYQTKTFCIAVSHAKWCLHMKLSRKNVSFKTSCHGFFLLLSSDVRARGIKAQSHALLTSAKGSGNYWGSKLCHTTSTKRGLVLKRQTRKHITLERLLCKTAFCELPPSWQRPG